MQGQRREKDFTWSHAYSLRELAQADAHFCLKDLEDICDAIVGALM